MTVGLLYLAKSRDIRLQQEYRNIEIALAAELSENGSRRTFRM